MKRPIAILFLITTMLTACESESGISVDGERLHGGMVGDTGIAVFRGIPFADAPVGDLRWQAPQALRTKIENRDVTEFAPACMQSMGILEWYRDMAELFGSTRDEFADLAISEDCLYLNIWSPNTNYGADLPVMIYIHGGSNDSGWAYEPDYHGHALAERDVVVVSIAYRLGVFGFFSHPEIVGDGASANFGLWDQIAALEWVQKHISKFGGDPGRVTIFGESAGAQDVLALMASEQANGLFHGGIMQSNAGFGIGSRGSRTLEGEQQRGVRTAEIFGFEGPGALQKLKAVPAAEVLEKFEEHNSSYYHAPAVDGQLLTESIWETVNSERLADVPFIIGSNGDEWYDRAPDDAGIEAVRQTVADSAYLNSPEALAAVATETDFRRAIDRVSTGETMLCPSQFMAALYDNAWVYHFTRIRAGAGGAKVRAYHGAELPYVFGTHGSWMSTNEIDHRLTKQTVSYWTQFAKSGNPNGDGLPTWPAFKESGNQVMTFGDVAEATDAPEPELCRLFSTAVSTN